MQLHDYKGCLHIHSTYSDGDVGVPGILDAARQAGLDYVVLADHDTLRARDDGLAGWHDEVLLVVGAEVRAGRHHCMALGLEELDGLGHKSATEHALEAIRSRGGLAFVVHPRPCHKPLFGVWVPGWDEWGLGSFDGVEIWPYLHDWISDVTLWNFLSHHRQPDAWVKGPDRRVLESWDLVGRRRRVVGIGALDNHARRFPSRRWHILEVLPHEYAFRTVRTHLLSPQPFCGDAAADTALLYRLLAEGRCYVSYDLLADPRGFLFEGRCGDGRVPMGSERPLDEPVELRAGLGRPAHLRLVKDGEAIAEADGQALSWTAREPGVYRVEVFLEGRPWIFSNPVYLRQPRR